MKPIRYTQLDSLRGLAATSVLFHHIALLFITLPFISSIFVKFSSPFSIVTKGHAAVILFFVLSGYVLSLPILNNKQPSYSIYLFKRICRIYVPYLFSLVVVLFACSYFENENIAQLSSWFNDTWTTMPDIKMIVYHILGIGSYNSNVLNGVYWSLIHEMRISLVFPIVVLVTRNLRAIYVFLLCVVLSLLAVGNLYLKIEVSQGYNNSFFDTLHILSFFLIGMILAKHMNKIIEWYQGISKGFKLTILILSLTVYNYGVYFMNVANKVHLSNFGSYGQDYFIALGVSGFIILAMTSKTLIKFLTLKPILFLGNISYSLYLLHIIVLFSLFHVLYGKIDSGIISLISVIVSILIAYLSWKFVEKPFIKIGKSFENRANTSKVVYNANAAQQKS